MSSFTPQNIARAGIIAALYVVLSVALAPISFGVVQFRVAEALTVLPFVTVAAVPGLFVGCLLANIFGGMGWMDIVFGPLLTLFAAMTTRWLATHAEQIGERLALWLAPAPPVLYNAFGVAAYIAPLFDLPFWPSVGSIGLGQLGACYVIGLPLLILLRKRWRFFV
jgi:uncharacterized membrane protein